MEYVISSSKSALANWVKNRTRERNGRPSYASRKLAPMLEAVESRLLLCYTPTAAGLGVIAGTAYVDLNHDSQLSTTDTYLPGATVQLFKAGQCTPVAQTKTDSFGAYTF